MTGVERHAASELVFLALALYREARGETRSAKVVIAACVLTRAREPGWWGKDILSVLFKKLQFSSLTDPHDPQLAGSWPQEGDLAWSECLAVADDALLGRASSWVGAVDSYYDDSIPAPKWATKETFVAKLGRINFHRLGGKLS